MVAGDLKVSEVRGLRMNPVTLQSKAWEMEPLTQLLILIFSAVPLLLLWLPSLLPTVPTYLHSATYTFFPPTEHNPSRRGR